MNQTMIAPHLESQDSDLSRPKFEGAEKMLKLQPSQFIVWCLSKSTPSSET